MNGFEKWIPSLIAAGALGAFYFLIRATVSNLRTDLKEELKSVWKELSNIKDRYLEVEKHTLICGKSALEIEKLFKNCLEKQNNEIFSKLRQFEDLLNERRREGKD